MAEDIQEELNEAKLQIGLMKKDINLLTDICSKMTVSIEKIQELNSNLFKMVAICEQRHNNHDNIESDLKERNIDIIDKFEKLNLDVNNKISHLEIAIIEKLEAFKIDLLTKKNEEKIEKASDKTSLEGKTLWMILGGIFMLGWFLQYIPNIIKAIYMFAKP